MLNASSIVAIHSVTVASYPAEFSHYDPLANIHLSKPDDCHAHPELKRKVYSALAEGDEGELSIAIPKDVVIRQSGHAAAGIMSEGMLNHSEYCCLLRIASYSCHSRTSNTRIQCSLCCTGI